MSCIGRHFPLQCKSEKLQNVPKNLSVYPKQINTVICPRLHATSWRLLISGWSWFNVRGLHLVKQYVTKATSCCTCRVLYHCNSPYFPLSDPRLPDVQPFQIYKFSHAEKNQLADYFNCSILYQKLMSFPIFLQISSFSFDLLLPSYSSMLLLQMGATTEFCI